MTVRVGNIRIFIHFSNIFLMNIQKNLEIFFVGIGANL
jgi:hypothetical protein